MLALALVATLALPAQAPAAATVAAPQAAPSKVRVLVLETRADPAYVDKVRAFGDLLATILEDRADAEIVPSSSVKDRLAVAADKMQSGCDDTACMTEIAGALDARYVVTSRASQVGGRWLMRVELFDGQDLKVVAQSNAMSDSVEGLASQAEGLADSLLAKAPMVPRKGAATGGDPAMAVSTEPPTTAPGGGMNTALIVGAASTVGALATAGVGAASFYWAQGLETAATNAKEDYIDDPNPDTRRSFAEAGVAADDASTVHNCVLLPIGCLCIPLGAVGVGGLWWGLTDDGEP